MNFLLDFFFPRYCLCCDDRLSTSEQYVCDECLSQLPRCENHSLPNSRLLRRFLPELILDRAASFLLYNASLDVPSIVHSFKYKGNRELGAFCGRFMAEELLPTGFFDDIDMIIPVPITCRRMIWRGYNQVHQLARGISSVTGIPYRTDILRRVRHTTPQARVNAALRPENVKGAFELRRPETVRGHHVLLLDDVMTTGSTLKNCGILLSPYASHISVLTFAVAGRQIAPEFADYNPIEPLNINDL